MAESIRTYRVAELLKHELAIVINNELNDPRVHDVVITSVKVTKDLGSAVVYFSSYDKKSLGLIAMGLEKSNGYIRNQLKSRVHLKKLPTLIFKQDETPENVEHLDKLFAQLRNNGGSSLE